MGGEGALAELDVTAGGIVDALRLAKFGGLHALELVIQLGLDGQLHFIGQLGAIGGEELDAVVVIRVVGGADDDASLGTEGASQVGHRRRRHGAHQYGLEARSGEARFQRRFQHVAGDPGVLADQHLLGALLGEHLAGGPTQLHHEIRGDRKFANLAADTIGAKILSGHCLFSFFYLDMKSCPVITIQPARRASMVSRTSCTRMIRAPCCIPMSAQARLPANRSSTGRPSRLPIIDFRDMPTKSGSW